MKFYIHSQYGELLDLALYLQNVEKQEVVFAVPDSDYKKIGEGMFKNLDTKWWNYLGQDYTFVFDGNDYGNLQDHLRSNGEAVFGGTEKGDKLENERQLGQMLFKKAGFHQPESKNFKDIDEALQHVKENDDRRWILKQNGSAPKSLNHMGKFDGGIDMIHHLENLKKSWNESQFGSFDCDLMEVVEGTELAASAFFNGSNWMKNKEGKIVGYLNFEEKKEIDGGLGETTGEMGTTFLGVTEDNELFRNIVLRPEITSILKKLGFCGVFDVNCILTKEGIVALEPTCRPGIPATSYEFIEGMKTSTSVLLDSTARGKDTTIEINLGVGLVMVIAAKPFPVEAEMSEEATSLGEKLWILKDGKPSKDFNDEQRKRIHLENFYKKDGDYLVATKNGYLLTITARGKTIQSTRESMIEYIKDNIYISGMKYRSDIGKRVESIIK